MNIRIITLIVATLMIVSGLCQTCYAESSPPSVLQYDLPFNESAYTSHTVIFTHAAHTMQYKIACIRCHHTLEEGAISVEKTCRDCHKNREINSFEAAKNIPGEKRFDYYFIAIHDLCVNCHKAVKEHGEGAKAPVGCKRCHVRIKK